MAFSYRRLLAAQRGRITDARRVAGRRNERQAMRGPSIAASALSIALLANGAFAVAGTTGSITGTVVAASGGAPVAGAR